MSSPSRTELELALKYAEEDMIERHQKDRENFDAALVKFRKAQTWKFISGLTSLVGMGIFITTGMLILLSGCGALTCYFMLQLFRIKFVAPKLLPAPSFETFVEKALGARK